MGEVAYIVFCGLIGYYAHSRGRNPIGWGILSFFFTPILVGIVLAVMKDLKLEAGIRRNSMESDRMRERMAASEDHMNMRMDSIEHRMDRVEQGHVPNLQQGASYGQLAAGSTVPQWKFCPQCGSKVPLETMFCPQCGTQLPEVHIMECPYCRQPIRSDALRCPHCRHELNHQEDY